MQAVREERAVTAARLLARPSPGRGPTHPEAWDPDRACPGRARARPLRRREERDRGKGSRPAESWVASPAEGGLPPWAEDGEAPEGGGHPALPEGGWGGAGRRPLRPSQWEREAEGRQRESASSRPPRAPRFLPRRVYHRMNRAGRERHSCPGPGLQPAAPRRIRNRRPLAGRTQSLRRESVSIIRRSSSRPTLSTSTRSRPMGPGANFQRPSRLTKEMTTTVA